MSLSFQVPQWQSLAVSSLVGALAEQQDVVDDVVVLSGTKVPKWLQRLEVSLGWELVALPDEPDGLLARMAVRGRRDDGGWEAAETISVFGFTGRPTFSDVLGKPAETLRALGARDIVTKVLPIPPRQWKAAARSSGIALIGGRPVWECDSSPVWVQRTNFVAGSDRAQAGRLIVHTVFADAGCRPTLNREIVDAGEAVYQGFVATFTAQFNAD